jgi:hypothetical protein
MDAIREQLNKPLVVGIASFLVGVVIGLVVLGWWLWPVQWTDAGPSDLRPEFQEIYLRMAIDSYSRQPDPLAAQQRVQEVGSQALSILQNIQANPGKQDPTVIQTFITLAQGVSAGQVTPGEATPTQTTPGVTPTPAAGGSWVRSVLPYLCILIIILIVGVVAAFLLRDRIKLPVLGKPTTATTQPAYPEYTPAGEEPPIAQFMTTYTLGNDLYDDSFSIDSQSGEFMGECGIGISETIGVGEPKRVTAFEVWLFDKNDIQTVTQVLMSQHAFGDDTTRQRLAAKGEPVFAEAGREMTLETATLRLLARVVDMSYGSGALPPESFFDRLTLQLSVWSKS